MHDKNGQPISVGDLVNIPARVTGLTASGESKWCNIMVETTEPMGQDDAGAAPTVLSLNAKQVVKPRPDYPPEAIN